MSKATTTPLPTTAAGLYDFARSFAAHSTPLTIVGGDPRGVELVMSFEGASSTGRITIRGATLTILNLDGSIYFKADEAFWSRVSPQPERVIEEVDGRWVRLDGKYRAFADMDKVATREDLVETVLPPETAVGLGSDVEINGFRCTTIDLKSGMHLLVDAQTGAPRRLELGEGRHQDFIYLAATIPSTPPVGKQVAITVLTALTERRQQTS